MRNPLKWLLMIPILSKTMYCLERIFELDRLSLTATLFPANNVAARLLKHRPYLLLQ